MGPGASLLWAKAEGAGTGREKARCTPHWKMQRGWSKALLLGSVSGHKEKWAQRENTGGSI